MVISASRKTDIPAFYGDWLLGRLDEGFCVVRNSFTRQPKTVSLRSEDIDAFVFWTKNPKPFMETLREVSRRGFRFYFQVTVTGYGSPIERSVAPWRSVVECCREICARYGPRSVVWRYDPIFVSEATPPEWHTKHFGRLADAFAGVSDEVTTSFVQPYRKVRTALGRLDEQWRDPSIEEKRSIVGRLSELAAERSMVLRVCSQPEVAYDLPEACCIDPVRLRDLGVMADLRPAPTRDGCHCARSVDIGEYDTCAHGCVYCYANRSHEAAVSNLKSISRGQAGLGVFR